MGCKLHALKQILASTLRNALLYVTYICIMETKLTLSMEDKVIAAAKDYAKKHNISLSMLVKNYFSSLTNTEKREDVLPILKKLSGILPADTNEKSYKDYLADKYK